MTSKTNELDFEEYIVDYLTDNDYVERFNENYSISTCLDIELLISFIKTTQTNKWDYLVKKTSDNAEKEFVMYLESFDDGLCIRMFRRYRCCSGKAC